MFEKLESPGLKIGLSSFHGCGLMSKLRSQPALALKALGLGISAGINLLYGPTFNPKITHFQRTGKPWPEN
jgi:hypothetical protein